MVHSKPLERIGQFLWLRFLWASPQSKSNQIRPNMTKSNQIRPNPTKADWIRPKLTESYQIRPKADRIRPSPTESDQIWQESDQIWPDPTKSDQIYQKFKIRPNSTKSDKSPTKSDWIRQNPTYPNCINFHAYKISRKFAQRLCNARKFIQELRAESRCAKIFDSTVFLISETLKCAKLYTGITYREWVHENLSAGK